MDNEPEYDSQDRFAESDEWLAAEVRQLFRAHRAGDEKAVEVALFYFEDFLFKTLQQHLRAYPSWHNKGRWFDGMKATPEYPSTGRLRLRGELAWVQDSWYYDPFDFELELCNVTGSLREYVFRFGDHRPLAEKTSCSAWNAIPVDGWAYEIRRVAAVAK